MLGEIVAILTKDPNLTNAIATVVSAIATTVAVFVSLLAVYISFITLRRQHQHNVLSVRPIAYVTVADFENSIRVKIRNHGSGPMLITRLEVSDGTSVKQTLIDWMPAFPNQISWTNFTGSIVDRSLLPGSEIVLLELTGNDDDTSFCISRDIARNALASLSVSIHYTDIYKSPLPQYKKNLSWFGRNSDEKS